MPSANVWIYGNLEEYNEIIHAFKHKYAQKVTSSWDLSIILHFRLVFFTCRTETDSLSTVRPYIYFLSVVYVILLILSLMNNVRECNQLVLFVIMLWRTALCRCSAADSVEMFPNSLFDLDFFLSVVHVDVQKNETILVYNNYL